MHKQSEIDLTINTESSWLQTKTFSTSSEENVRLQTVLSSIFTHSAHFDLGESMGV